MTLDDSDARTPDKMWGMIKKGIPVRVEVGTREMDERTVTYARRDLGKDSKVNCSFDAFIKDVHAVLDEVHHDLYKRAKAFSDAHTYHLESLDALEEHFKEGGIGFAVLDSSIVDDPDYERIKKEYSLTSRCMPFEHDGQKVIVGKAY